MSAYVSTRVSTSLLREPSTTGLAGICVPTDASRNRLALTIGISGARRNAAVAACEGGVVTACCEQERLTRVRGIRLEAFEMPSEAVPAVLTMAGNRRESEHRRLRAVQVRRAGALSKPLGHKRQPAWRDDEARSI